MLLYRSGLRISEALDLKPSDVNMERAFLPGLARQGQRGHDPRLPSLGRRRALRGGWIPARPCPLGRTAPLFCTLQGGRINAQQVRNLVKRLGLKAGVDKRVHPHAFRHTYAVELEAAGTPVTTISKLLGHSSIAVTHRYLSHLTNEEAIRALESIDLPEVRV